MGKRKLLTGILLGASIGGLASLLNKDVRNYTKTKTNQLYSQVEICIDNPSHAVRKMKNKVVVLNEAIANNATSAVKALEQVENSLQKMLPNKD